MMTVLAKEKDSTSSFFSKLNYSFIPKIRIDIIVNLYSALSPITPLTEFDCHILKILKKRAYYIVYQTCQGVLPKTALFLRNCAFHNTF